LAKRKSRAKPLSAATRKTLQSKANKSRFTFATLRKVYRRGQGAFLTAGSRPGVGMQQWAMGRVNSFLRGSRKHDLDLRRRKR
tara:strand:+ start:82 stop:330 length:249 start_codon:yes stop_codon:yes gene_type:complete